MSMLIDGHNLIGAMPDLQLDDPDDEEKLLVRLRSYRARVGKRLVVYFDAGIGYQLPSRRSSGGITVRQAGSGQQADKLIIRDVSRHRNPRELTVVTSDRTIQQAVQRHKVRVIDSATFAAELSRQPERDTVSDMPSLTEEEVQEWLTVFQQSNER